MSLEFVINYIEFSVSSIPSYLIKNGYASEADPDANKFKFEDTKKRDVEVQIELRQKLVESLLENAKLCTKEPITSHSDHQLDGMVSCELADDTLTRLDKVYPIQKSVWPHILSRRSVILVGNTDFYPHLMYLPPICDMIKVMFSTRSEF